MAFRLASLGRTGASRAFAKVRLVFYLEKCAGCNFIFYECSARAFCPCSNEATVVAFPRCRSLIKNVDNSRFFAIHRNTLFSVLSILFLYYRENLAAKNGTFYSM